MKLLLLSALLLSSVSVHAQGIFKVPKDTSVSRSLKNTKHNHLIILSKFRSQIDSEINRLVHGIEYESARKESALQIRPYQRLLVSLLVKRIFVQSLESQLKAVDLDLYGYSKPPKKVFNTENIKVNLEKEMSIHLDAVMNKKNIGHYFLEDLKASLIRYTLKTVAVKTYQSVGSGLLARIVTSGVSQAAFKSTLLSMGSQIFVSAGTASLLSILTFPLHAYRAPPESIWTDILEKNPELILNPEWMRYAGSSDDPWFTHNYAIIRRTEQMERALKKFLQSEENSFMKSVTAISKIKEFKLEPKKPSYDEYPRQAVDGTYVHRNIVIMDFAPFWALKKK